MWGIAGKAYAEHGSALQVKGGGRANQLPR